MIFSHLSISTLIAYIRYYDLLIQQTEEGSSKNNIMNFKEQCEKELEKKQNNG